MTGRKLGRGLDMLIARESTPSRSELLELDPNSIRPNPQQPRKRFSIHDLESLKASIAREGVLQPLLVRKAEAGYELVAGERRLRASQDLGLAKVPAIVVTVADDRLLEVALIENIQREDLNPIELAQAYRQLMDMKTWTQELLAQNLGLSRPVVSNTIRLLELPDDIQNSLIRGHVSMGHAKVLLSVADPREQRLLFERIAEEKLSVRDLEGVKETTTTPGPTPDSNASKPEARPRPRAGQKSPHILSLEEQFSEKLGTKVRIREKNGRGRIAIDFYSKEDFERIRHSILPSSGGG